MIKIVHEFETKVDAELALTTINTSLGIPISPDSITKTYCNIFEYGGLYYISADDTTKGILSDNGIELTITEPTL